MIDQSLVAKVISLSPADRLELMGAVWDSLSLNNLPVNDDEKALLDARLADRDRNPDDQSPWSDVNQTRATTSLSFDVQVRRSAELDVAEAQSWYETQRGGLGGEFHSEVSQILERLAQTPLMYATVYRDVRRAVVRRFPYFIWFQVVDQVVTVLACSHWRQEPGKTISRFR